MVKWGVMTVVSSASVAAFQRRKVHLRLSVSHACQLNCAFCHQEGIDSHWQPIFMDPKFFEHLTGAYASLGGCEINLSGGDPLMHPAIGSLIEIGYESGVPLSICTNGLALSRISKEIAAGKIHRVKLSFHSFSRDKPLLGERWNPEHVLTNIRRVINLGGKITVNFTMTSRNIDQVSRLLDISEEIGFDILLIDLIPSRFQGIDPALSDFEHSTTEALLAARSSSTTDEVERSGAVIRHFTSAAGRDWMYKNVNNGLHFTGMCDGCDLRSSCGEGVFTLRVDSEAKFAPCLIRRDLDLKCPAPSDYQSVYDTMAATVDRMFPAEQSESNFHA